MAQRQRGIQTHEELLQAAARLFSIRGYHATGTADILEAVSLSKGAFYHHFKSKDQLALAVLDRLEAEYRKQLIDPVMAEAPEQRLQSIIENTLTLNQSGRWMGTMLLARLMMETAHDAGELGKRVCTILERLTSIWTHCLAEALPDSNAPWAHQLRAGSITTTAAPVPPPSNGHPVASEPDQPVTRPLAEWIVASLMGAVPYSEPREQTPLAFTRVLKTIRGLLLPE